MRLSRWLYSLAAVVGLVIVGSVVGLAQATSARSLLPAGSGAAAPGCTPGWSIVPSPNSTMYFNVLYDVVVIAPDDVWAVGADELGAVTLHWDGVGWSSVPNPAPGTAALYGVAAVSANDVWAIGIARSQGGNYPDLSLTMHWDGQQWLVVPNPNPGYDDNFLRGVVAIATDDVWAVGTYSDGSVLQILIEHWDGSVWSMVAAPDPGDTELKSVTAHGSNDVWAVGEYLTGGTPTANTIIEHWDGSSWSIIPSVNPGVNYNSLSGVSAAGANDVWAVGFYTNDSNPSAHQALIEHWDGTAWNVVASPPLSSGRHYLVDVSATAADDVWAVGFDVSGSVVEHWNGSEWRVVPHPSLSSEELNAVSAGGNDVWVVGDNYDPNSRLTFTEQYTAQCAPAARQPAHVAAALQQDPDQAVAPGDLFTYTVRVQNDGPGTAFGTGVRIALDPGVEVLDFHSGDSSIYVDYVGDDAVSVLFHTLSNGQEAQAQIIARVRPGAAPGTTITSRAVVAWDDDQIHRTRQSNSTTIQVGPTVDSGQHGLRQALGVEPAGPVEAGTALTLRGAFFGQEETVSFWLNLPDGTVRPLPPIGRADREGLVTVAVDTTGLAPGLYTLVAHGWASAVEGVGAFAVR